MSAVKWQKYVRQITALQMLAVKSQLSKMRVSNSSTKSVPELPLLIYYKQRARDRDWLKRRLIEVFEINDPVLLKKHNKIKNTLIDHSQKASSAVSWKYRLSIIYRGALNFRLNYVKFYKVITLDQF